MPIDRDVLNNVIDVPWKKLFESMEDGKYYSINEAAQMLIGREIVGSETIKKYLDSEERKTASMDYIISNLTVYLFDVTYVWITYGLS